MKPDRVIEVAIKVPTPAWSITIERIFVDDTGYYVVSRLSQTDGIVIQMIATARDKVTFQGPDLPVKEHFVIGKTWGWENTEPVTFIEGDAELKNRIPGKAVAVELP